MIYTTYITKFVDLLFSALFWPFFLFTKLSRIDDIRALKTLGARSLLLLLIPCENRNRNVFLYINGKGNYNLRNALVKCLF